MSSSTTQKFRDFTGEPLKDKLLSDVPGVGPKLASNLEGSGITKVSSIGDVVSLSPSIRFEGLRTVGYLSDTAEEQGVLRTLDTGQCWCQSKSSQTMCRGDRRILFSISLNASPSFSAGHPDRQ